MLTFVDASTFAVTTLATGRGADDAEQERRHVAWLEDDAVLVLVYGAPMPGEVVRVDLKRRVLLGRSSPPLCPAG